MRLIGQAHSLVHQNGVVRIQTDIRVGTRLDPCTTKASPIPSFYRHSASKLDLTSFPGPTKYSTLVKRSPKSNPFSVQPPSHLIFPRNPQNLVIFLEILSRFCISVTYQSYYWSTVDLFIVYYLTIGVLLLNEEMPVLACLDSVYTTANASRLP